MNLRPSSPPIRITGSGSGTIVVALDDMAELLAPDHIVFCEGSAK